MGNPAQLVEIETGAKAIDPNSPLATKKGLQEFKQFLTAINERWRGLKLTNHEVDRFDGEPNPKHLNAYLEALGVKEFDRV